MTKHYSKSRSKTTSHRKKSVEPQQITEQELHQDLLELIARAEQAKTLTAMVTLVMVGLRVLGLKLIRLALERRDETLHRHRQGPPCCPRCGRKLHKPKRKWTTRVTLLGKLRYRRRSWLCARCHKTHQPLDATLDLVVMHHGHSLEFVRELTLLCTLHAFEQGCTLFERCFGFEVSTHLAHRMVMGIGGKLHKREMARAKELWKRREKHPEEFEPTPAELRKRERADRLYVMLDSCEVSGYVEFAPYRPARTKDTAATTPHNPDRSIGTAPLVAPTPRRSRCLQNSFRGPTPATRPCPYWAAHSKDFASGFRRVDIPGTRSSGAWEPPGH